MPVSTLHRQNQAPIHVPYVAGNSHPNQHAHASAPTRQLQRPNEHHAPKQHRPGIARKIANFVLNGGRRHTGRHAATLGRTANVNAAAYAPAAPAPAHAPAPVHHAPAHASPTHHNHAEHHAPSPLTSHLHYPSGRAEGTGPQEIVYPSTRQPLLTSEQVNHQLGLAKGFGDLQMVIHLPGAKEPLYTFKSTQDLGKGNVRVDYVLATPSQLKGEDYENMVRLNRFNNGETAVNSDGVNITIGKRRWLPGRAGKDHREQPNAGIPDGLEQVAADQLKLRINDTNGLVVQNLATPYDSNMDPDMAHGSPAAVIELNPNLIPAGDEWAHVPIDAVRGTTYLPHDQF